MSNQDSRVLPYFLQLKKFKNSIFQKKILWFLPKIAIFQPTKVNFLLLFVLITSDSHVVR